MEAEADQHDTAVPNTAALPIRDVTGLVLAGGASRRFGTDKAVVPVDGVPMVQRVFDTLCPVVSEVVISIGQKDRLPVKGRTVRDVFTGCGPLAGLHAGLTVCNTTWLLVVACDLPFVRSGDLQNLLGARTSDLLATVAVASSGSVQPLCACYHASVLPLAEEMLASEQRSMHGLLDRIPWTAVTVPEKALRNVNTPEDLK